MTEQLTEAEIAAITRKIDLNRGVTKRTDEKTGVDVYMYKDTPGEYYDGHGKPVSHPVAKAAGFDVEEHQKILTFVKKRREIEESLKKEMEIALEEDRVIAERAGYKVRFVGAGLYQVLSPDGLVMNSVNLPKEIALELLSSLAPEAPKTKGIKVKSLEG